MADAVVVGDASWLHQLFSNLVANAIHHTPAGGRVLVESRRVRAELIVDVSDSGPGIPEELRAHVFERFERSPGSNDASGFGLGLPIALEIARAHGGRIRVESEPGKGARFSVHLPLAGHRAAAP